MPHSWTITLGNYWVHYQSHRFHALFQNFTQIKSQVKHTVWSVFFLSYLWDSSMLLPSIRNLFMSTQKTIALNTQICLSFIKDWFFVSGMWNKLRNNAAMNIHRQEESVYNFLRMKSIHKITGKVRLNLVRKYWSTPKFFLSCHLFSLIFYQSPNTWFNF